MKHNPSIRLTASGAWNATLAVFIVAALPLHLSGCDSEYKLQPPLPLQAPWAEERSWAAVPFSNESGVSEVDTWSLTDRFVVEIDEVDGLSCLPLNRTIMAMRALGLKTVSTPADARALLKLLQVDGLVVGTVTAYDPYRPLQLGVAVEVYSSDAVATRPVDMNQLTLATGEAGHATRRESASPFSSQVAQVYDANNHEILARLTSYATGRSVPRSGLGPAVYTASMDAYSRFVAYDVVAQLLRQEQTLEVEKPEPPKASPPATHASR